MPVTEYRTGAYGDAFENVLLHTSAGMADFAVPGSPHRCGDCAHWRASRGARFSAPPRPPASCSRREGAGDEFSAVPVARVAPTKTIRRHSGSWRRSLIACADERVACGSRPRATADSLARSRRWVSRRSPPPTTFLDMRLLLMSASTRSSPILLMATIAAARSLAPLSVTRSPSRFRWWRCCLKIDFDSGKTRVDLFRDNVRFSGKLVLIDRIEWFPSPSGSSVNHAWFVWDREHRGAPRIAYADKSTAAKEEKAT